jgi:predicted hotdog family 3-hydroxylacyl-ACP dehydratase
MLEKTQIEGLLPHHGKMFLLEHVFAYDRDAIECGAVSHRDADNPLRHADKLPAHAAIEYAAQAAGVHGGLLNRDVNPTAAPQMGYLAVLTDMQWNVERLDDLPDVLRIYAQRTAVTPGGRLYRVRIEHQAQVIMSGELVIALEPSGEDSR